MNNFTGHKFKRIFRELSLQEVYPHSLENIFSNKREIFYNDKLNNTI
jgi:hypothetical protein